MDRPVREFHERVFEKPVYVDRPVPEIHEKIVEKPVFVQQEPRYLPPPVEPVYTPTLNNSLRMKDYRFDHELPYSKYSYDRLGPFEDHREGYRLGDGYTSSIGLRDNGYHQDKFVAARNTAA